LRLRLAILRNAPRETSNTITRGDLVIDCDRYEVTLKGLKVDLTYKEYELLKYLASNPGRVFTRESLLRSVWEYDYFGGTRTVDVHVRRLRSKINDVSNHFIETQWNVGYRFRSADKSPEPSRENSSKFNPTI
ncbi:MAG TPA: response regulator transcription factor, partial [Nitrospinaceae bacterium]|nr:response regulator transcription factor [Nitrospinaceae bacterium]